MLDLSVQVSADVVVSPAEPVLVSGVITSKKVPEDVSIAEVTEEKAKVVHSKKKATVITEVETIPSVEKIKKSKPKVERATSSVEDRPLDTCKVTKPLVQTKEIEDALKDIRVEDFGPGEQPLKELATVSVLMKKGVTVDEVNVCYIICIIVFYSSRFQKYLSIC